MRINVLYVCNNIDIYVIENNRKENTKTIEKNTKTIEKNTKTIEKYLNTTNL